MKKKNPRRPLTPPNQRHEDKREKLRPREEHELLDKLTYEDGVYWPAMVDK